LVEMSNSSVPRPRNPRLLRYLFAPLIGIRITLWSGPSFLDSLLNSVCAEEADPQVMSESQILGDFLGMAVPYKRVIRRTDIGDGSENSGNLDVFIDSENESIVWNYGLLLLRSQKQFFGVARELQDRARAGLWMADDGISGTLIVYGDAVRKDEEETEFKREYMSKFFGWYHDILREHAWMGSQWGRRRTKGKLPETSFFYEHALGENKNRAFADRCIALDEYRQIPVLVLGRDLTSELENAEKKDPAKQLVNSIFSKIRKNAPNKPYEHMGHAFILGTMNRASMVDSDVLHCSDALASMAYFYSMKFGKVPVDLGGYKQNPLLWAAEKLIEEITKHYQKGDQTYLIDGARRRVRDQYDALPLLFMETELGKRKVMASVTQSLYGKEVADRFFGKFFKGK